MIDNEATPADETRRDKTNEVDNTRFVEGENTHRLEHSVRSMVGIVWALELAASL